MANKVKVTDGGGTWLDENGEVMTKVWTSEGWKDLPGEYEVHHKFLECECPDKESLNLTIVIEDNQEPSPLLGIEVNEIRFLNVQSADFEEIE